MGKEKKRLAKINSLLISNVKSENMFLDMLDNIDHDLLKNFLRVASYERNQFVKALDAHLRSKGITPSYPEETLQEGNNTPTELITIIAKNDYISALSYIGKIQIRAIEQYKKALNNTEFSDNGESLLSEQLDTLIKSLYSIEVYKDLIVRNAVSA